MRLEKNLMGICGIKPVAHPSFFMKKTGIEMYILVYADDLLILRSETDEL